MRIPAFDPLAMKAPTSDLAREAREIVGTYTAGPALTTGLPEVETITRAFPTSEAVQAVPEMVSTATGTPIPSGGGGGGGITGNPIIGMATKTAQNVLGSLDPLSQVGMTTSAALSPDITEAAALLGGSGLGTPTSTGGTGLGGASILSAFSGAAMPALTIPAAKYLSYIPVIGTFLATFAEGMGRLISGPTKPSLAYLKQNALIGQSQASRLNYLLGMQGRKAVDPMMIGTYNPNISWMRRLRGTEAGRKALGFETYPYLESTGLKVGTPEYDRLMQQLEGHNLGVPEEERLYPYEATQYGYTEPYWTGEGYYGSPTTIVPSGYIGGLRTKGEEMAAGLTTGGEQTYQWLGIPNPYSWG